MERNFAALSVMPAPQLKALASSVNIYGSELKLGFRFVPAGHGSDIEIAVLYESAGSVGVYADPIGICNDRYVIEALMMAHFVVEEFRAGDINYKELIRRFEENADRD